MGLFDVSQVRPRQQSSKYEAPCQGAVPIVLRHINIVTYINVNVTYCVKPN